MTGASHGSVAPLQGAFAPGNSAAREARSRSRSPGGKDAASTPPGQPSQVEAVKEDEEEEDKTKELLQATLAIGVSRALRATRPSSLPRACQGSDPASWAVASAPGAARRRALVCSPLPVPHIVLQLKLKCTCSSQTILEVLKLHLY